jgi:hypothetical protein
MDEVENFFCQFPNPCALRVSGMGGYTSKCEKSQNHCTLMSTPNGSELHLDVSTLQRPVLHLDMSTPHGPELHLDLCGQHEPCRPIYMHGSELLLGVSTLQIPVLHLDVSPPQGPELHLDLSGYQEALLLLAAPGNVYIIYACDEPRRVYPTGA